MLRIKYVSFKSKLWHNVIQRNGLPNFLNNPVKELSKVHDYFQVIYRGHGNLELGLDKQNL